jgi:hypothetical protein
VAALPRSFGHSARADSSDPPAAPRTQRSRSGYIPVSAALRPIALIGIVYTALSTVADPDLWGHLRFGLDILDNRGILSGPDRYSFTADRPFVYHEWLGGTVMAALYRLGGPPALMAMKAVLALVPGLATWYLLRRAQFFWRWLGTGLVAWGTFSLALTLRPQLWTVIGIVIVSATLTRGSKRSLWWLPPLFALWANLHGGWIVGGGMLALWTAVAWVERNPLRWTLLVVGVASLASTLFTPYGFDLWSFLLETVRFSRDDISEWQPIWTRGMLGSALAWVGIVLVIAWSWRAHGRPELAVAVTLLFLAIAAARVNRNVPLFIVAAVILLSRQWPRKESAPDPHDRPRIAFEACCIAIFVVSTWISGSLPNCITLKRDGGPDTLAAEALRGASGRIVTFFDWGEYVLWHFGPTLKISIDGRRETLYSMAVLHEQYAILEGRPQGFRALERIRPEYVWLPARSSTTAQWLRTNGYREDVRTDMSFIAVRSDLPRLRHVAIESSGCFPGP